MESKAMRLVFGESLVELADRYPEMVVLDADVSSSTQTKLFGAQYPERFFNFGVAEANMVSAAAGMAACGLTPVASTFAFLLALRAGDAVRSLVAYNELNVKLAGGYAGLSDFADGASHQSVSDIAVMQAIPNITIIVPSDITSTRWATEAMLAHRGPVFLRLSREAVDRDYPPGLDLTIGRGVVVNDGEDVTIVACGVPMRFAREAVSALAARGMSARLIDLLTVKPLDRELLVESARKTGAVVTVEEHNRYSGVGSSIAALLGESCPTPVLRCGIPDRFGESGAYAEILDRAGIGTDHIVDAAAKAVKTKQEQRETQ